MTLPAITVFTNHPQIPSNRDTHPKKPKKKSKSGVAIRELYHDYSDNTSIHGLQYIGHRDRSWLERIFWIIVFVISLVACLTQIYQTYQKWEETPVIVSFAEKSTPIWHVPFPAVTICPQTKAPKNVFDFTGVFKKIKTYDVEMEAINNTGPPEFPYNLTKDEFNNFRAISQLCILPLIANLDLNSSKPTDFRETLSILAPTIKDTLIGCRWNEMQKCGNIFRKTITEAGVCFTFNSIRDDELFRHTLKTDEDEMTESNTEWSLENGYNQAAGVESYPRRVFGAGSSAGLHVVLRGLASDVDFLCRGPVQGYKVLIHPPSDVPRLSAQYFRLPYRTEVTLSVQPNMITTSDSLKNYDPFARKCYFIGERYLRFFKIYSQTNCEFECIANFTLSKCGCLQFSLPGMEGLRTCDASDISCYRTVETDLITSTFNGSLSTGGAEYSPCDCLPSCMHLSYSAEISQGDYDAEGALKANEQPNLNPDHRYSRLALFFKERQFLTSKRSELYGVTDFLSNCGGLLGLFMGFSVLSFVEILYFCTFRMSSVCRTTRTMDM